MADRSIPSQCDVVYKLHSEPKSAVRPGITFINKADVDQNDILSGRQSQGQIEVVHSAGKELYDLFYMSFNEAGQGPALDLKRTLVTATLNGAIDDSTLSLTITPPSDTSKVDDALDDPTRTVLEIEGEFLAVDSHTGYAITVVARGAHGTGDLIAAHSNGVTVTFWKWTIRTNHILMDALSAPPALDSIGITAYSNSLLVFWTHTLTDAQLSEMEEYVIFKDDATFASFDANDPGAYPAGVEVIHTGSLGLQFLDFPVDGGGDPDTTNPRYYRVAAKNKTDVYSTVSDVVSSTALASVDPPEFAAPDPPITDIVAAGFDGENYRMTWAAVFASTVANLECDKIEVAIAAYGTSWAAETGFVSTVMTFYANKPPVSGQIRLGSAGQYSISARAHNGLADVWSNWGPVDSAAVAQGKVESFVGVIQDLYVYAEATTDNLGHNVGITTKITDNFERGESWWGWDLQLVAATADWKYGTLEGLTSLRTMRTTSMRGPITMNIGVGTIVDAGATFISWGVVAGDQGIVMKDFNLATGEMWFPHGFSVISVDSETQLTISAKVPLYRTDSDGALTSDYYYCIGAAWAISPSVGDFLPQSEFKNKKDYPYASGELKQLLQFITISTPFYCRVRYGNYDGLGQFWYHDEAGGSTDRLDAALVTPDKIQAGAYGAESIETADVGDYQITGVKQSKGSTVKVIYGAEPSNVTDNDISLTAGGVSFVSGAYETFNSITLSALTADTIYWIYKTIGNATLATTTDPLSASSETRIPIGVVYTPVSSDDYIRYKTFDGENKDIIIADQIITKSLSAIQAVLGTVRAGEIEAGEYLHLNVGADLRLQSTIGNPSAIQFGTGVPASWSLICSLYSDVDHDNITWEPVSAGAASVIFGNDESLNVVPFNQFVAYAAGNYLTAYYSATVYSSIYNIASSSDGSEARIDSTQGTSWTRYHQECYPGTAERHRFYVAEAVVVTIEDGLTTFTGDVSLGGYAYTFPSGYGTDTYVLTTDGAGGLTWTAPGGSGLPSGTNTQTLRNNSGTWEATSLWTVASNGAKFTNLTTGSNTLEIENTGTASTDHATLNIDSGASGTPYIFFQKAGVNKWSLQLNASDDFLLYDRISTSTRFSTTSAGNSIFYGASLTLQGASSPYINVQDTTNTVNTFVRSLDTSGWVGTYSNHAFAIYTNNTQAVNIDTSQNVAVGTTAGTYKFRVSGTSYLNGNTTVSGTLTVTGTTTFNSLTYTWPASRSASQFLQTDASGNLSWTTISALPSGTADQTLRYDSGWVATSIWKVGTTYATLSCATPTFQVYDSGGSGATLTTYTASSSAIAIITAQSAGTGGDAWLQAICNTTSDEAVLNLKSTGTNGFYIRYTGSNLVIRSEDASKNYFTFNTSSPYDITVSQDMTGQISYQSHNSGVYSMLDLSGGSGTQGYLSAIAYYNSGNRADMILNAQSGVAQAGFAIAGTTVFECKLGPAIGFFNVTPVVRASSYTITNFTSDKSFNCNAADGDTDVATLRTRVAELYDIVATVINDLKSYGLFQGTIT